MDTNPPWTYLTWVHEVQASWCHGAHSLYPVELNQIPKVFCLVRGWISGSGLIAIDLPGKKQPKINVNGKFWPLQKH